MKTNTILVTGGAGYIGSHAVLALLDKKFKVVVLDNLIYGHKETIENLPNCKFIQGDIRDTDLVKKILVSNDVGLVMHFAAYAYVGESVKNPSKYYYNNVVGTLSLLQAMLETNVMNIVFSSSCATYGIPKSIPIKEEDCQDPINAYGASKLMIERVLADYDKAYGLKSVIFRYFNAAGADPNCRSGEDHNPETHIIPLVLDVALGKKDAFSVFGDDYETPDGTCIRDFVHVSDIASAHIKGLNYLIMNQKSNTFNLSNSSGTSVLEIINMISKVTKKNININIKPKRKGDPAYLVGDATKALDLLKWKAEFDLESMIKHAWIWHNRQ